MKANELRVGNWLYDPHGKESVIQVSGIAHDVEGFEGYILQFGKGHKGIIDDDDPLYLPIPLTPEILEKCGFEFPSVIKDVSQLFFLTTDRLGFRLQFERSQEDVYVCESLPLLHIEHLHQLQNLYFALTGTELEYNPIKETI